MLRNIARDWWLYALLGVASIVFGVLAFVWPGITLQVLVVLFGAFAIVDGGALLVALARGDVLVRSHPWASGAMGVLGIAAGVVALIWPNITALVLLYIVAAWAIAVGILQIAFSLRVRTLVPGEFWMALGGVVATVFGVLLAVNPGSGLVSLTWLVGIWAIAYGIASLGLAHRLQALAHDLNDLSRDLRKLASTL